MSLFFEDIAIGATRSVGSHTFTREAIIAFARKWDPQPFHLSDEGGEKSRFGSLIASGWHTASTMMRLLIVVRDAEREAAAARGERLPELGVSPGLKDMRWIAPVRPGDTLDYSVQTEWKRTTKKPKWGLVASRWSGINQTGSEVFTALGIVFVERRDGVR